MASTYRCAAFFARASQAQLASEKIQSTFDEIYFTKRGLIRWSSEPPNAIYPVPLRGGRRARAAGRFRKGCCGSGVFAGGAPHSRRSFQWQNGAKTGPDGGHRDRRFSGAVVAKQWPDLGAKWTENRPKRRPLRSTFFRRGCGQNVARSRGKARSEFGGSTEECADENVDDSYVFLSRLAGS